MKKILNNCKKFNLVRKMLVVLLVFAMTFGTFAAVVSDNDSSAFVTKAELEALKTSYEKQVKNYYDKINEKVDNTIVAYLNYWHESGSGIGEDPYPVGSVFLTVSDENPGTVLGGTWEEIAAGQTLVGSGEDFELGSTGGNLTHKLTVAEMVTHTHEDSSVTMDTSTQPWGHTHKIKMLFQETSYTGKTIDAYGVGTTHTDFFLHMSGNHSHYVDVQPATIGNTGGSSTFSLLEPYLVIHIWKRIE